MVKPVLEDGEIVYCDNGIYQRCPVCKQLTPKLVEVPDFNEMQPGQSVMDMKAKPGNLQPLCDLRGCRTGMIDYTTGESRLHVQCETCGQALKDEDGNYIFQ